MSFLQAIFIAILQGATELFPVSSLGHAVILPALLHWSYDLHDISFLPFLVMLHLGTSIALLIFFWSDWMALFRGTLGLEGRQIQRESVHILLLLVIATIPAVIIGALFEHVLRQFFGSASSAAIFLILNGLMLLIAEKLRGLGGRYGVRTVADMTVRDALVIGLFQCIAFFPGFSRSGATICGGLIQGLRHDTAARFAFLMAEPVILAATAKEGLKMRSLHLDVSQLSVAFFAALVAGCVALLSTAFLMRYFQNHDKWALSPFAYYCICAGILSSVLLHFSI
ncbi:MULTISPECIES: undecaprenyl-diphosphate phosphatase [Acetobacter]|uniref:Undecaprenyl-diphosphatase n=1 Tax=Acetobacter thailandicus TaxID=1502842 RepID=A0ABT3QFR7_9PROT|nr:MULTISPECIES: undecaprenyl-diphosphate phosphatase [Acetobacter]MBS0985261.1 undecaprenyl-diphosphate phosphatase [Acetobacter thailandicus]MBS1002714.1 undecaprenyl-diphosphate phosphatase [Acetobacter thailandicus]MCX2564133.1 undecaprenyl-diphosphate phosphatase [Acetobacter thailandicus]NHN95477.1 undecaprenyl-diphosphate phosphatase [Acetobacter thailandicus]OUI88849.1 UDP pyrophosphate phosphatase [Acetobacter sp. DmW_043]